MTGAPGRITVTVRFLARYAELAGREFLSLDLSVPATVADALRALSPESGVQRPLPANPLCALNFRQVRGDHPLNDGDELALLPPMAGG